MQLAPLKEYAKIQRSRKNNDLNINDVDREEALKVINAAREEGRDALTEIEAKQVFKAYGLDVTNAKIATSEEEAVSIANEIGFPIVMKIVSPDILHKSDAGGVKVGVNQLKK